VIDLSDARPLRESEVTPFLRAEAQHIEADPARYPIGSVVDLGNGIVARVEVHTWIGATGEKRPDGVRGTDLWHVGPHAPTQAPHEVHAEGIDLSNYQPSADMDAVAASGRSFVYVRSGDGLAHDDTKMLAHYQRAGVAGLARGFYHYLRASRSSSDQVAHFLERCQALEDAYGRAELPPCLDVETADGVDLQGVAAGVARAVESLAAMGRRPLLYTMPGFWDTLPQPPLSHVPELADLWVAHWDVQAPRIPRGWTRAALWQYSATAVVPGVGGRMDVDRFPGGVAELLLWGAGGGLPALTVPLVPDGRALQRALNAATPKPVPLLAVDGDVGRLTRAALEAYRVAHGLADDRAVYVALGLA
jgi:lysozyme